MTDDAANDSAAGDMTPMEQAQRDFSFGLLDAMRTLACALVRAGVVRAAELQRDFTQRAEAVRKDGGTEIRAEPVLALAAAMAKLVAEGAPPEPTLRDAVLDLFGICNALCDTMVRRNVAPPLLLRNVLAEWISHGREVGGDDRVKLAQILAHEIGQLDAPPPSGERISTVITLAARRARSSTGGGGDAA